MRARRIRFIAVGMLAIGAMGAGAGSIIGAGASTAAPSHHGDGRGDLLITDQFNNRVIEVNPYTRRIVWQFGSGDPTLCNPGPGTVIGPNDAERLAGGLTLIAGTGVPAGASPADPTFSCADNRVIVVNAQGSIVWQYGQAAVSGSGPDELNVPVFAIQLPDRNILITDQGNNRIIEVDRFSRNIVWSYGPASGPGALNGPNSAELLPDGHILIADQGNNRIIEITRSGHIVWQYGSGNPSVTVPLDIAAFASRLPDGDTLITDSADARIVEVTHSKQVVFAYFTNSDASSNAAPLPTNAVLLHDGDLSIADQFNDRVLIVRDGAVLFQYGEENTPGDGPGQLDGPYTSFVIGDYTGQTPPPPQF